MTWRSKRVTKHSGGNDVRRRQPTDFALLEYAAVVEDIRLIEARIRQNYHWVLATTALVLTSQLLGMSWSQLGDFTKSAPLAVAIAAVMTLWFPAYDLNMWTDLRVAEAYRKYQLEPRLRQAAMEADGEVPRGWMLTRDAYFHSWRIGLRPVWITRLSLPYWPTLVVGSLALRAQVGVKNGGPWWIWVIMGFWGLAVAYMITVIGTRAQMVREEKQVFPPDE